MSTEKQAQQIYEWYWNLFYSELIEEFTLAYVQDLSRKAAIKAIDLKLENTQIGDSKFIHGIGYRIHWSEVKELINEIETS